MGTYCFYLQAAIGTVDQALLMLVRIERGETRENSGLRRKLKTIIHRNEKCQEYICPSAWLPPEFFSP